VLVVLSHAPFSWPLTPLQMRFTSATSRKAVKMVSRIILRLLDLVKNALSCDNRFDLRDLIPLKVVVMAETASWAASQLTFEFNESFARGLLSTSKEEKVIEEVLYHDHALRVILQVIGGVHPYQYLAKLARSIWWRTCRLSLPWSDGFPHTRGSSTLVKLGILSRVLLWYRIPSVIYRLRRMLVLNGVSGARRSIPLVIPPKLLFRILIISYFLLHIGVIILVDCCSSESLLVPPLNRWVCSTTFYYRLRPSLA